MNKKLYMEWLGKQMEKNNPDGPITEARRTRSRRHDIDYYRSVIAGLLDREDSSLSKEPIQPHSLEPKSGLADFQQSAARQSLKTPHVEPIWSYRARNTLGAALGSNTVYEGTGSTFLGTGSIRPGALKSARDQAAAAGKSIKSFKAGKSGRRRIRVVDTNPVSKPENKSSGGEIVLYKPTGGPIVKQEPTGGPLATTPKGGPIVKREPTGGPIVKYEPPVKQEPIVPYSPPKPPPPKPRGEDESEKSSGASNPLGGPDMKKRDKSKYTSSYHSKPRPGMTPFGIKPGSGEEYGGQTVTESKLNTLVSHHVNKFLKTKQGRELKQEASKLLTKKD